MTKQHLRVIGQGVSLCGDRAGVYTYVTEAASCRSCLETPVQGRPHGSRAPDACAPDGPQRPRLRLVEPPPCGHEGEFTHMHCAAPADHPEGLHYYVASNGSHVNDKHGGAS